MTKFYVISEQDLSILAEADYLSEAYTIADGIEHTNTFVAMNPLEASIILWQQKKQSLKS